MRARRVVVGLGIAALIVSMWRAELYTVQHPGDRPAPLAVVPGSIREAASFDVVLPCVPVGTRRLTSADEVTLVHYWAPWQTDASRQAADLDSLRRLPELAGLRVLVVCSDPFPSVARYVARRRLRLTVLLDGPGRLKARLPCPSIPFTYVLDGAGRIAVRQAGEVEWLSPVTRATLATLLAESRRAAAARAATAS